MDHDTLLDDIANDEEAAVVGMVLRRREEIERTTPKRRIKQRMPSRATKAGRKKRAKMAQAYLSKRAQ